MAMDSGSMSPADVAAVVDNRGGYGYGYPVFWLQIIIKKCKTFV